jgi:hypothetical protein
MSLCCTASGPKMALLGPRAMSELSLKCVPKQTSDCEFIGRAALG